MKQNEIEQIDAIELKKYMGGRSVFEYCGTGLEC